jgi:hypothetical protein
MRPIDTVDLRHHVHVEQALDGAAVEIDEPAELFRSTGST